MMTNIAESDSADGRGFFPSSQAHALPFYERFGFEACSDELVETGIPHREMRAEIGGTKGWDHCPAGWTRQFWQ